MKTPTIRTNRVRLCIALIAGFSLATSSKATVPTTSLPNFDNLPNFSELGNQLNENNATIIGNVGVSENGTLSIGTTSTIFGDVSVGNGATVNGTSRIAGSTFTGQDLTLDQIAVFSASSGLDLLPADKTVLGNQTSALNFNVPAGQIEVVDLNGGLNLSGPNSVTVTGGGDLVLNILGSFSLTGNSSIVGNAQKIFVNYLGTGTLNSGAENTVEGQVFIPNAAADVDGTWVGAIYSGNQEISLLSRATLNGSPVPEPGAVVLISAGLIPFLLLARRRRCRLTGSIQ